jgi:hypothetical protein
MFELNYHGFYCPNCRINGISVENSWVASAAAAAKAYFKLAGIWSATYG